MTSSTRSQTVSKADTALPQPAANESRRWTLDIGHWTSISTAALLTFGFGMTRAGAQTPAAMDQVDSTQQRRSIERSGQQTYQNGDTVPALYPGEEEDVGPQSVLAIKRRHTLFEGVADSQYYYTDNVFLDHNNRVPSGVLVSTAQIALAPTPYPLGNGELAPRVGFREQWFNFFQYTDHSPSLSTYNFSAQTSFVDEHWIWHNRWSFGGGFDYTRLLTVPGYNQFYAEYTPRWDATYTMPIGFQSALTLGYQGYYHFADAPQLEIAPLITSGSFFDRLDQLVFANFTYQPCEHVFLQPYYVFRYTHFTSTIHRDDYLNSVGIGAYYTFNRFLSARIFTSFDHRDSNVSLAEYNQFAAGVGANVTLRF